MSKIDFKKKYKSWYHPSKTTPEVVDIPELQYLMIDGEGYPADNSEWTKAVEALYPVAFGLKFMFKKEPAPEDYFDYVVPPLEGLWWSSNADDFRLHRDKPADWRWTGMIMLPDFYTQEMVERKIKEIKRKKDLPAIDKIRLETLKEGRVAQIMHIGPYSEEGPTIDKLHSFVEENGWKLRDKHHEIYLGDPRRTAPEKLKTVIRHPITQ